MDCVIVSKARDGSTTIRDLFYDYIKINSIDIVKKRFPSEIITYVSNTYELWPAIIRYIEEGDHRGVETIFEGLSSELEIGHGYGFLLPLLATVFGRKTKLIIIHRECNAHVRSLVNRLKINPEHWISYSDDKLVKSKNIVPRPTAVHYGEISEIRWNSLSPERKFRWFIDKQTKLIEEHRHLFDDVIDINTEDLNNQDVIKTIFQFVYGRKCGKLPKSIHVHKTHNMNSDLFTNTGLKRVEEFWEQIDFNKLVTDDQYAIQRYREDMIIRFPERKKTINSYFDSFAL